MNEILNKAWAARQLTVSEKCVLARLADFAAKDGIAFPGHKRLATDCSLSERHVARTLRSLVAKGQITITKRCGHSTKGGHWFEYRVHPTPDKVSTVTEDKASGVTPDIQDSDTGQMEQRHRTSMTSPIRINPIEPSTEPSAELPPRHLRIV